MVVQKDNNRDAPTTAAIGSVGVPILVRPVKSALSVAEKYGRFEFPEANSKVLFQVRCQLQKCTRHDGFQWRIHADAQNLAEIFVQNSIVRLLCRN